MDEREQATLLLRKLWDVLDYFRSEYDINYASVIGVLEIMKADVCLELKDAIEEEEGEGSA